MVFLIPRVCRLCSSATHLILLMRTLPECSRSDVSVTILTINFARLSSLRRPHSTTDPDARDRLKGSVSLTNLPR
ncbi:hypothetical protein K491DRAFT_520812 [Lophiostoma macrostomum CBS 122681]|uniref:Uncharacterized protein n=1 Tax=Lophiostoma macrostomum CBS 122681 TaxID=1314788 RepID=A0A6A6T344_9PLEO|nr:hypothetical protein K491DRAFT_520812 [Lophiostoma macrostomum CBS 122681]